MSEYAKKIAHLQKKMKLVATEDILSDKGVLLAKSGIEINKKTCETILKFKLLKLSILGAPEPTRFNSMIPKLLSAIFERF